MNTHNKMWFSLAVLFTAWACLADVAHTEASSVRSKRLVGGTLAPRVPWQAMIYLSESILDGGYAGGALISDRWVLTAGRNLFVRKTRQDTQGKSPIIPKVYLGILGKPEAGPLTEVAVEKVVLHPAFQNHSDWDNDLALLKLKEPVVMSDKVTPIPLPKENQQLAQEGSIAGWGWGYYFTFATSLKHLVLPVVSSCNSAYQGDPLKPDVDDNMFCTKATRYGENVCFGDSGSALAMSDPKSGDVYAAGILSYDKSCTSGDFGVYMKISSYLPWLHSIIRGDTEESFALRATAMTKMLTWQPRQ
ncbi:haptoglobin-like [Thunnus albacares]|uniref:haptoglobin-like n=1 Tax=Thunnus albacares TaxID=8236 RepID=UPI001CF6C20F|nr:haptoglobin-like [Thunnus albacares]